MKKVIFTLAAVALLLSVGSCTKEKEGRYAPKQKIQSVYQESTFYHDGTVVRQEPKYKSEEWTWVDDRLDRITYYNQNTYEDTETGELVSEREQIYVQMFSYDKDDRLVKSEILGWANMVADLVYDGKYLKTMTVYDEGQMLVSYQFNHEDKRITSFDLTLGSQFEDMDEKTARQLELVSPLRFVLTPEQANATMAATERCAKRAATLGSKASTVLHFSMEWKDDNVSRISASYMGETALFDFKYDSKNNPFYGLFELVSTVENSFMPFQPLSKNNVTGIASTESSEGEAETSTDEYTYTYNANDYPTSKKWVDDEGDDYRYELITYYEYK